MGKAAGKDTSSGMFWKLLGGTVAMLAFGYCGEIHGVNPWFGFCGGLCGWFFILQEIFMGEAGGTAADCSEAVATSFSNMRLIVTLGWSIYPLGYLFGCLELSTRCSSMSFTTLRTSSTRLLSCCLVGLVPNLTPNMLSWHEFEATPFCAWLRIAGLHLCASKYSAVLFVSFTWMRIHVKYCEQKKEK